MSLVLRGNRHRSGDQEITKQDRFRFTVLFPRCLTASSFRIIVNQIIVYQTGIMQQFGESGDIKKQILFNTQSLLPVGRFWHGCVDPTKNRIVHEVLKYWIFDKVVPEPPFQTAQEI